MALTLNEFKCWLEGFEEAFNSTYGAGNPNKEQWQKIKAKLAEVETVEPHMPQLKFDPAAMPLLTCSTALMTEGTTNV